MIELVVLGGLLFAMVFGFFAYQARQFDRSLGRTQYEREQMKEKLDRLKFYREEYGVELDPDYIGFKWMYNTKEGKTRFWRETRNGEMNRKFKEWRENK